MKKNQKIFVAGHRGLVGSSIYRRLLDQDYTNLITRSREELPLDNQELVDQFFKTEKPEYVFLAAAKVGGIQANASFGADFIRENIKIQTNVIDAAYRNNVKKLVFLGSSCVYPKFATQPIQEDTLLTGELERTNLPYAVAKIAGITMCNAYREQYGFDAFTVMPSNVYGIGDNFDLETSHVVAGIMCRIHNAKFSGAEKVTLWGTGTPLRELIYVDDLADAIIFLMNLHKDGGLVNVGSSEEISIAGLALMIAEIIQFKGEILFDHEKPDGTPRKIMDNSYLNSLGWRPSKSLKEGLLKTYSWWYMKK